MQFLFYSYTFKKLNSQTTSIYKLKYKLNKFMKIF